MFLMDVQKSLEPTAIFFLCENDAGTRWNSGGSASLWQSQENHTSDLAEAVNEFNARQSEKNPVTYKVIEKSGEKEIDRDRYYQQLTLVCSPFFKGEHSNWSDCHVSCWAQKSIKWTNGEII